MINSFLIREYSTDRLCTFQFWMNEKYFKSIEKYMCNEINKEKFQFLRRIWRIYLKVVLLHPTYHAVKFLLVELYTCQTRLVCVPRNKSGTELIRKKEMRGGGGRGVTEWNLRTTMLSYCSRAFWCSFSPSEQYSTATF